MVGMTAVEAQSVDRGGSTLGCQLLQPSCRQEDMLQLTIAKALCLVDCFVRTHCNILLTGACRVQLKPVWNDIVDRVQA
jgi:hypothetical protein